MVVHLDSGLLPCAGCAVVGAFWDAVGMDDAVAAVLAAVISAAVVGGTFAAAEVIKVVQSARRSRVEAVLAVVTALEAIPVHASKVLGTPRVFRGWVTPPDLDVGAAAIRLFAYLPRRDWPVAKWVGWRLAGLEVEDAVGRVRLGAEVNGVLIGYLTEPKRIRRYVSRWEAEILEWDVPDRRPR